MMSPRVTLTVEDKEVNMDRANRDGAEWEGRAADPDCLDLNYASLRLSAMASMAHKKVKWSNARQGTEKWRMILVIGKGKMSLSQDAKSL